MAVAPVRDRSSVGALVNRAGWRPWHYAVLLLIHAHFFTSHGLATGHDMLDVFYPWADAVRTSIVKFHQFPWWNPWAMAGQPLFADPASVAVLMPDTLLILLFGTVAGLKVDIVLYTLVGYEGCRALCRHLFGDTRFVRGVSIIPAIVPALALHFNEGHIIFVIFYLVPWMVLLSLTWEQTPRRSLAFGVVIGLFLLSYIHYTIIMALTLMAPVAVCGLWRSRARGVRGTELLLKVVLVFTTALGLALVRIAVCLVIVAQFPRTDTAHYPIVASLGVILSTLVEPFQNRDIPVRIADLGWWELGSYVGLPAIVLAYEGLRRDGRRLWALYLGIFLCVVLAWNNRDPFFPSTWLHKLPLWKNMIVISRWGLFASLFILLGAVHGLVMIRRGGHAFLASMLAVLVTCDLGYASYFAFKDTFTVPPPPIAEITGPPRAIADWHEQTWAHERQNMVSLGAVCSLVGWGLHPPARQHIGSPGYNGDVVGRRPVAVESWTPNRFVLVGTPGDQVTLNINPSSYWTMNGNRLFPDARAFEIDKPFQVTVPPGGRMVFRASDPGWKKFAVLQGLFALLAAASFFLLERRRRLA